MQITKMNDDVDWKYPASVPYDSGYIIVSEHPKHSMHWEEYGNPHGEPVIFLHGGPGGTAASKIARVFDPARYRIILFDQRGCGQSLPHIKDDRAGGLAENDTAHLVQDIETLRTARGITGKAHIFGGSWGATLALTYAQAHPEHVQDLILRGIFLCDKQALDFFYQGNAATYADNPGDTHLQGAYRAYQGGTYAIPPELQDERMKAAYAEAWHKYVTIIPPEERGDMIEAYHRRLNDPKFSPEEKLEAALAWSVWEGVTSHLNHDVSDLGKFGDQTFAVAFATIENEYFHRALRGKDEAIKALMQPEGIATLAKIPIHIVQGAHDQVCVPANAHRLRDRLQAASAALDYQETVAGHSMFERATSAALTDIMDRLPPLRMIGPRTPLDHATRIPGTREVR